jgi:hypothetical protein
MSRRRLTLVDQVELGNDLKYDGLTLRNFSAGSPICAQLFAQLGENEAIAIHSADGGRARLVANLGGMDTLLLPRLDPAAKWSLLLKISEFCRSILNGNAEVRKSQSLWQERIQAAMRRSETIKSSRKKGRRVRKRNYE